MRLAGQVESELHAGVVNWSGRYFLYTAILHFLFLSHRLTDVNCFDELRSVASRLHQLRSAMVYFNF